MQSTARAKCMNVQYFMQPCLDVWVLEALRLGNPLRLCQSPSVFSALCAFTAPIANNCGHGSFSSGEERAFTRGGIDCRDIGLVV